MTRIWGFSMKRIAAITFSLILAMTLSAFADSATTQPTDPTLANKLQLQANEAMGRGDYAAAAVLLQKVEQLVSDQPDVLGPVMEQLRVCRKQVLAGNSKGGGNLQNSVPLAVDGGARHIHPIPTSGQTVELPIKELGNFDYDPTVGGGIPTDVTRMEGCHFKTTGYMIPLDQAESISEFALVPSLFACCFGQPPQIQHTIVVHCPKSKALDYFPDELVVEGTLHVKEDRDGGFIVSIFQMDASSVKAAPQ
jgi:hypothetical protein